MTDLDRKREAVIDRINAKRDFKIHAAVFTIANLVFVLGWLLTGPASYFWPIWPFLGWGQARDEAGKILVLLNGLGTVREPEASQRRFC